MFLALIACTAIDVYTMITMDVCSNNRRKEMLLNSIDAMNSFYRNRVGMTSRKTSTSILLSGTIQIIQKVDSLRESCMDVSVSEIPYCHETNPVGN